MTTPTTPTSNMVSLATLDLLLLTYNCAKEAIDVPVFAAHLQRALSDNGGADASTLPDLVVFSLQEVAPLGYAFAGSYFLGPYLSRFDDALERAAAQVGGSLFDGDEDEDEDNDDDDDETARLQQEPLTKKNTPRHYHLVRQEHVGMTAILLFAHARRRAAISDVQAAHCGFGIADMGNKGAVGLRVTYAGSALTFVATHLAAMEWNKRRRNANWRSIVAGLTFGNPRDVLAGAAEVSPAEAPQGRSHDEAASAPQTPEEEAAAAAADDAWLLMDQQEQDEETAEVRRQLQHLSIFRPDSLLFVAGDLNYRIGDTRPPPDAAFPTAATWPRFLDRDQLTQERRAGRTLHGLQEAPIAFAPTYKHDVLSAADLAAGAVPDNAEEVASFSPTTTTDTPPIPWRYATHRWPSWCDRVLYLDVPAWASTSGTSSTPKVHVTAYASLPLMATSDHQAVYFRATVPLLGHLSVEGAPPPGTADPRVRLPVAIDPDAWARRARARNKERLAAGGMLLFNTRAGAASLLALLALLAGLYWAWG